MWQSDHLQQTVECMSSDQVGSRAKRESISLCKNKLATTAKTKTTMTPKSSWDILFICVVKNVYCHAKQLVRRKKEASGSTKKRKTTS